MSIALLPVSNAGAQTSPPAPAAPIPVQIPTGKKVFISNAGSDTETDVPDLTYNRFYADVKNWGKYELVPAPADADLVFEISFLAPTGPISVTGGSGISSVNTHFRLVILDPKTHVVLWTLKEQVRPANRVSTERKNYDQAMTNLVDDLKKLAGGAAGGASQ